MTSRTEQRYLLQIRAPEEWDFVDFVENVANDRPVFFKGCDVIQITDVFADLRAEIEFALLENGLSNLLRRQLLTEEVVEPGLSRNDIRDLLIRFLANLGVDSELIIVDPYFFAKTSDSTYPDLVREILAPFTPGLRTVHLITRSDKVDATLKNAVEQAVGALPGAPRLVHVTSDEYHDRFWITRYGRKLWIVI